MKRYISILFIIPVIALIGCNRWLDVKPKTQVDEKELFRNEQGFKEALTGVYVKMSEPQMYGRELTYGFIDILAQRYTSNENVQADYANSLWYTYPSERNEGYIETFWKDGYNLIANLNNLIRNIDERGQVITTEGYRNIIKGEALGLRSFLYFDLLRMFGPVYKNDPSSPSLPYRTSFDSSVKKLLPANQLLDSIIGSLHQAEKLLEDDPMYIAFPKGGGLMTLETPEFLSYRFNRMNKYAVKAELARAYLWKGDKANAAKYAQEVIDAKKPSGEKLFRLITDNMYDKIGSTELIFSMSMDSKTFPKAIESEFTIAMWNYYIITDVQRLYQIFDVQVDGQNDMRFKEGVGFSIASNGAYTLKYNQKNLFSYAIANNVPLIRLPEMYYILAECTDDNERSAKYLSEVRLSRGVEELTPFSSAQEKQKNIEKEYRKEFYAEGQLWFYYKRLGLETFLFAPRPMEDKHYRFTIPADEVTFGNIQ